MAGNVFGLNEVYDLQKDNATDLDLNIPGLSHGYIAGGADPYTLQVDKLDFKTEVVSTPGNNLSQARAYQPGGVSSGNYGYIAGGWTGSANTSTIDRVDFSNDTVSQPGNPLGRTNYSLGSVSGPVYGYIAGGTSPTVCTITRIDFSSDTVSANPGQLTQNRSGMAGMQSPSYGYFAGGLPLVCTIDRLDFSNDTVSDAGDIPRAIWFFYGVSSSDYGYTAGGNTPGYNYFSDVYRIDFSNDNTTTISANLDQDKYGAASTQSLDFGYWTGGYNGPGSGGYVCTVNRLDFSNETMSQPSPQMPIARGARAGIQANRPQVFKYAPGNSIWKESPNYGYWGGGATPVGGPNVSTVDRIDYASETVSAPGNNLIQTANATGAVQNSNYGYFGGGQGSPSVCTISRLEFTTETVINSTAKVNRNNPVFGGISGPDKGYFAGFGPEQCSVDRLDFTTETLTSNPSQLGQPKREPSGTQNDNYGYIMGGKSNAVPIDWSTINRVDFATDIFSTISSALPQGRRNTACVENTKNAYICLGADSPVVCTVERMEFSTETVSAIDGFGPPRWAPGGNSSFSYGYVGGGADPGIPENVSTINRLDFDTETSSTPSSKLTLGRRLVSSVQGGVSTRRVGKATYGYVAGGVAQPPGSDISTIDRFEFSTETVTNPAVIGNLTRQNQEPASFSSSEYGYFGGGYSPNVPGVHCQIDRLDFSNDTVSGNSSSFQTTRYQSAGIQNSNYGYAGGGNAPSLSCTIARLDFSTETVAQPNNYSMTLASRVQGSISGPSYGYFAGGLAPGRTCKIDRFDFTTETGKNAGFALPTTPRGTSGTQNTNDGYFAGGDTPTVISSIFKLDFTTETLTTNPNNLSQARTLSAKSSSGDGRYGYFYGGNPGISTIDRIEFDSGTVSTPSQTLTSAKYSTGSVANG